jgi:hypothetical protein
MGISVVYSVWKVGRRTIIIEGWVLLFIRKELLLYEQQSHVLWGDEDERRPGDHGELQIGKKVSKRPVTSGVAMAQSRLFRLLAIIRPNQHFSANSTRKDGD